MTPYAPVTTINWQAVGFWQGGTVTGVALSSTADMVRGLLASRAGVYGWSSPGSMVLPLSQGMNDPDVVSVTFAGGNATAPATAFAATATGRLYRSVQRADGMGHDQWQEVSTWAGLGIAVALAPSPAFDSDGTLFAGTPNGIFRTLDNGQSWESCNFGLLDEDVLCILCSPTFAESEVLWAGTAGGGLYRSRNSARAWRESGIGLPDAPVQSLAVSPNFAEDQTVFVGMEAYGVYVSHNGGEEWTHLALDGHSVNSIACPQPNLLFVGTNNGLWRVATDGSAVTQILSDNHTVFSVAANDQGHVAVGLFGSGFWITEDGTVSVDEIVWQTPDVALHAPPVVIQAHNKIFALDTDGAIAVADEGGTQWKLVDTPDAEGVFALAAVPDSAGNLAALFAVTDQGISQWNVETGQWVDANAEPFGEHTALGIERSPTFAADQTLLVTTQDSELFLSEDGGSSWQAITGPWRGQSLLHARFGPENAKEALALSVRPSESGHFDVAVWHTADQGKNWEGLAQLSSGVPSVLTAWPHDNVERPIFLSTQHRVIKLYHEQGTGELKVHQHFFDESVRVTALACAADYADSGTIWAATTVGLYRSMDRGLSWGLIVESPHDLPVVWLEVGGNSLTAITLGSRIWRATL